MNATMTTSTVWLWLTFSLLVLGLAACSDDFVALIKMMVDADLERAGAAAAARAADRLSTF